MINFRLKQSGLTIIEVLIMVIIVLELIAVILPEFINTDRKLQQSQIKQNMKIVQMAADAYAINNLGKYPLKADDPGFKSFFPGGNANIQNPNGGHYPENPFSRIEEAPQNGNITDVRQISFSPPCNLGGPRVAGKIFYSAIASSKDGSVIGYAILGAGKDGMVLPGASPNMTYVLSNLLEQTVNKKAP